MTKNEIMQAARAVVVAHVRAINGGDETTMRTQLVGSTEDGPFRAYCKRMQRLKPLAILSMHLEEPERRLSPPYPRTCVYVKLELSAGQARGHSELPVWVLEESGRALIASRISLESG